MRKIPKVVKVWLFIYGLFFGSVMGGLLVLMRALEGGLLLWWFALNLGTLLFLLVVEWRYKIVLGKWLPTLTKDIAVSKPLRQVGAYIKRKLRP